MRYKLIAIDLDGTLLDSGLKISQQNRDAIKLACEKGAKVIVCTGRAMQEAGEFAAAAGMDDLCIAANGAVIKYFREDKKIYENAIPLAEAFGILDTLHDIPELIYLVYAGDRPTCEIRRFDFLKKRFLGMPYIEGMRRRINIVKCMKRYLCEKELDIQKILIASDDHDILKTLRNSLGQIQTVSISSSIKNSIEIARKGVDKGAALRLLCRNLNIDSSEVMAIGDELNDVGMIEFAGYGVAMGNACEKVRKSADFVTYSNDESGVAYAIKMHAL